MVKIKEAIVVEGRYDKNTLSQIVNAPILETNGFGIFKTRGQKVSKAFDKVVNEGWLHYENIKRAKEDVKHED